MTDEEFLRKFREQTLRALEPEQVEGFVMEPQKIEQATDVTVVIFDLRPKKGGSYEK